MARIKARDRSAWYHLWARCAAHEGEFPLEKRGCKRQMAKLLLHYAAAYCCRLAGFCVLGNHWHTVLCMARFERLGRRELERRAALLYPGRSRGQERWREKTAGWGPEEWERFNRRLHDVSELMRNVQAGFARWYNATHGHRGRFWADRFGSTLLEGAEAILGALLYVELNAVRAGLAERPEDYPYSGVYLRAIGRAEGLVPLQKMLGSDSENSAMREYLSLLYYRGNIPAPGRRGRISDRVLHEEELRGFRARGVFLKRLAYFAGGLVVGTEVLVRQHLMRLRRSGRYLRRRNPISQLDGALFSLREQRGERRNG